MSKKTKKAYTAEELFDAIPGDYSINEKNASSNINNINKIKEIKSSVNDIEYCDDDVKNKYICSEIMDQGLLFVVNDGDVNFAKCMIVLPEYSNIGGENKYLDASKKYTYVLMNELNLNTKKRRVSARVIETDEFEAETGINVEKYFKTKDNIELFADEISKHINLLYQCSKQDTIKNVLIEIMKGAMHP